MNKMIKRVALFAIVLLLIILLAGVAFADLKSSAASLGGKVKGLFHFDVNNPGFADFVLFFIIFLSLSWIGLSRWFEGGGGASRGGVIGLAVGMSLGLAAALVYGGKFGIGKLLPFAFIFLGIILFIALYALMSKMLNADSVGKKIFAFIIAAVLTIVILSLVVGSGICEKHTILKKVCGSESIFGKLGGPPGKVKPTAPVNKTVGKNIKRPTKYGEKGQQCYSALNLPTPPSDCICVPADQCDETMFGEGKCRGLNTVPCRKTKEPEDKIPAEYQKQIDDIAREVNDLERQLNAAIKDADEDKVRHVRKELEIKKISINQIIRELAKK